MRFRDVVLFIIKALLALVLLVPLWQSSGISRSYHLAMVSVTNRVVGANGFWTHAGELSFDSREFVFRGYDAGRSFRVRVNAGAITSNLVLLAALFAASPIRPLVRIYLWFLLAALLGMFFLHNITLLLRIQSALLNLPSSGGHKVIRAFINYYVRSYSYLGLYVFVLACWCPYILVFMSRKRACVNQS